MKQSRDQRKETEGELKKTMKTAQKFEAMTKISNKRRKVKKIELNNAYSPRTYSTLAEPENLPRCIIAGQ